MTELERRKFTKDILDLCERKKAKDANLSWDLINGIYCLRMTAKFENTTKVYSSTDAL